IIGYQISTRRDFLHSPPLTLEAAPRYRSQATSIQIEARDDRERSAQVFWSVAQRALTPGQICAFYEGEVLLGGGVFSSIHE
ncbi:MAG: aminomethyltransferase beta-barrel domain-containing protein, partial [Verrucomicrobiota bacterium]